MDSLLFSGIFDLPWWSHVIVALALTHITIVAVTVFLHRHQAHCALELHPVVSHFFHDRRLRASSLSASSRTGAGALSQAVSPPWPNSRGGCAVTPSGREKMTATSKNIAGLAVLALAVPALTSAADGSVGQREYESKCAMCHGATGEGDGWFAQHLKRSPSPLTQLQKKNGGVFPFDRVYQVIDGRKEVIVHGPRTMPVWGNVYRAESDKAYGSALEQYFADDGLVRARILALTEYISRLQKPK